MMRFLRLLPALLLLPLFFSCNKDLDVNAGWKDITVVYGLLDASADTTYLKITKAFLGEGDALRFSQIPDSSIYPDKLEVRLDEYADTTLIASHACDTVTIHNKRAGDSIFYYPDQLMYYTLDRLNVDHNYKLVIRNRQTGKTVTGQTAMVRDFEVFFPNGTVSYPAGQSFRIKWRTAAGGNGKRYQLVIRFYYQEWHTSNPGNKEMKVAEWRLFNSIQPSNANTSQNFDLYYPADAFYSFVGGAIPVNPVLSRSAHHVDYIFTVAAPELSTYMDVNLPSLSLIQEKPAYSNITNGIGLFSARFTKPVDSLFISNQTKEELTNNESTRELNFIFP